MQPKSDGLNAGVAFTIDEKKKNFGGNSKITIIDPSQLSACTPNIYVRR